MTKENLPNYYGSPSVDETIEVKPTYTEKKVTYKNKVQEKNQITVERHLTELAKLRDEAQKKGAWSAAINAEVARGKAGGLYVDQKLIMTGNLDNMSEKELEAKMAKILDDHKNLIDVTPEGIEDKSQQA